MKDLLLKATALETELASVEQRHLSLAASLKAAAIEADAARDPRQFAPDAFDSWFVQPRRPADTAALLGIGLGLASGTAISILVSILLT
jgi:hypothetical protein